MDTYDSESQKIVRLIDVEINVNYAIIITTNAGLWRYQVGDTVRFTSINPYRIRVTGRTKHHINVFGEELIIENADAAISKACKLTNSEMVDYTVAPIFMEGKSKGGHEWIIEFRRPPENQNYFNEILDQTLQEHNSDYEAKRYNNMTLNPPKIHPASTNLFHNWLKKQDKLGGQNKIPRLSNQRTYLDQLLELQNSTL